MDFVRRLVHQLLTLATLAVASSSFANSNDFQADGPRWACWYASHNLSIQCLLSRTPVEGHELRAAEVAGSINRRLPKLVQLIWGSPEQLAGERINIPLMSVPFEMEFVRQLARSVMCGARHDCSISFDANDDGKAPVRAAALEAGASESEVMAEVQARGYTLASAETPTAVVRSVKRPRGA